MPNPWDVGTALVLEQLGFKALATTSAGYAWSLGRADSRLVPLDETLEHLPAVAGTVTLPVNADFEGGFADDPEQVARNVKRATETGIAGLSLEDSTGDAAEPLHKFDVAVERVRAARRALFDESGTGVLLTGRSERFVVGLPDIDETILILKAYAEAGADYLYAPKIASTEHVSAIVEAVSPQQVNVLANAPLITVPQAVSLGVRRISVGGTLARTAWKGFLQAAHEVAGKGTFSLFDGLPERRFPLQRPASRTSRVINSSFAASAARQPLCAGWAGEGLTCKSASCRDRPARSESLKNSGFRIRMRSYRGLGHA